MPVGIRATTNNAPKNYHTMSDLHETAQVSEEESGSAAEPLQRKGGHSNPVVSRTVEFQGMMRTNSEDGPPIASSSQTSDISGDEEEASMGKDDTTTLKLPKKKKGMSAKERAMLRKGKWTVSLLSTGASSFCKNKS